MSQLIPRKFSSKLDDEHWVQFRREVAAVGMTTSSAVDYLIGEVAEGRLELRVSVVDRRPPAAAVADPFTHPPASS